MGVIAGEPFLFGKLPAHGDFVARGLTEAGRQAWDDWATAALEQLRAVSPSFEDAHDAAAPWRFVAGPSALGDGWRIGALAASIDSAGRRFVLVAGLQGCAAGQAAAAGMTLAALIEDVLYRALAERLAADAAIEAVRAVAASAGEAADLAAALAPAPSGPGAWWSPGLGLRPSASPPLDLFAAREHWIREPAA